MRINDNYINEAPQKAAALALFPGAWASRVPVEGAITGEAGLFEDARIAWLLEQLGSIEDWSILELGPLECGHTSMLHAAGAGQVTAIEANTICFLKCLVVKELLGLTRARLQLGNFDRYLESATRNFDLIVASGVLYHLVDPLATLLNMMKASRRIFIWSHYFDEVVMPPMDPRRSAFTGKTTVREIDGSSLTYHERTYGGHSHAASFCGGVYEGSVWLNLGELRLLLSRHGYTVTSSFEHPDHPNGPAACLLATRP